MRERTQSSHIRNSINVVALRNFERQARKRSIATKTNTRNILIARWWLQVTLWFLSVEPKLSPLPKFLNVQIVFRCHIKFIYSSEETCYSSGVFSLAWGVQTVFFLEYELAWEHKFAKVFIILLFEFTSFLVDSDAVFCNYKFLHVRFEVLTAVIMKSYM
jgi:hypothetical protein